MTSGSPVQVLATHTYAPNGHELSFTGASNHVITYAYDGLDRFIHTTFPDFEARRRTSGTPLGI